MAKINVFISHAWRYSDAYNSVVSWLNEAQYDGILTWSNYSVPSHNPVIDPHSYFGRNKLKEELKGQIAPASKIIVISGMYAAHSDWIDFEIDTAVAYGKYIIGLKPWGQERIPSKIQYNAKEMVGWNRKSLIDAILK